MRRKSTAAAEPKTVSGAPGFTGVLLLALAGSLGAACGAFAAEPMSAEELNKQLNNPVSSVWSLQFQNNYTQLENDLADLPGWDRGSDKWFYNLNFQPVMPVRLTEEWNLINRVVFPFFDDRPVFGSGGVDEKSGMGDITAMALLSPAKLTSGFLWGAGPSFIFPSATDDALGQEKWQAGPAAVGLYLGKDWVFGVFPQHWWSFAGSDDREDTSQSNIQYFVQRLLPGQWQVGMSPNITIDWKADSGNELTLPIGLGVGKLVMFGKLPVKFILEGQYAVIHPDDVGQRWNVRFQITPVIPPLLKGPLFD